MADSALQRKNMVESQVRPSDVTDRRITGAMQDIAREPFLPASLDKSLAYMDAAVPCGGGRALMAPRTLARLVQLAGMEAHHKVLIVGALTGYSAAIVSRMAAKVFAVESDAAMADAARQTLTGLNVKNVEIVTGDLTAGFPAGGPYNAILVEGAVEAVPEALSSQLADGGRLVAIEQTPVLGRAVVLTRTADTVSRRIAFEAAGALLPGFAKPAGFVF